MANILSKIKVKFYITQLIQYFICFTNRLVKYAFFFLCIIQFASCHQKSNKEIPYIIVERKDDSLRIGEVFTAKIYLSDTSFYNYIDDFGKRREVYPVFKVNDEITYVESDTLIYTEKVDSNPKAHSYKNIRESAFSIIFPHPKEGEGTIEVSKRIGYVIVD